MSMIFEEFLLLIFYPSTTRPPIFLSVHNRFYLSKWRVGVSLHKAMEVINIHRGKPSLNRDIRQELPPVMLQLVSHDVSHVTWLWNSVHWRRLWDSRNMQKVSWEENHLLINNESRNQIIAFELVNAFSKDILMSWIIYYFLTGLGK